MKSSFLSVHFWHPIFFTKILSFLPFQPVPLNATVVTEGAKKINFLTGPSCKAQKNEFIECLKNTYSQGICKLLNLVPNEPFGLLILCYNSCTVSASLHYASWIDCAPCQKSVFGAIFWIECAFLSQKSTFWAVFWIKCAPKSHYEK